MDAVLALLISGRHTPPASPKAVIYTYLAFVLDTQG
uniref:Uncharacterized protein n=1 Tax=Anguilla anguilla TaxID=7936 RepID=A0A0E9R0B3_ANGAN